MTRLISFTFFSKLNIASKIKLAVIAFLKKRSKSEDPAIAGIAKIPIITIANKAFFLRSSSSPMEALSQP
ncbi:hypothetical protein NCCP2648_04460 [Lacticaseibacillus rhamnosus]|nr:hypothetical protein NCCP2648_04460 [Lacticaseibacillus rhamnosus]